MRCLHRAGHALAELARSGQRDHRSARIVSVALLQRSLDGAELFAVHPPDGTAAAAAASGTHGEATISAGRAARIVSWDEPCGSRVAASGTHGEATISAGRAAQIVSWDEPCGSRVVHDRRIGSDEEDHVRAIAQQSLQRALALVQLVLALLRQAPISPDRVQDLAQGPTALRRGLDD